MKSTLKNIKDKITNSDIGFGSKTDEGYVYKTKIDLGGDLSSQISMLIKERKAKQELDKNIKQISEVVMRSKNKHKNLDYYSSVGKKLFFLKGEVFKNIKPFSVFRNITDEIPNIIPGLDKKRVVDHLVMMFRIADININDLKKASWDQWYEISKFKNVFNNKKLITKILTTCGKSSGPDLRNKIQIIVKENI